MAIEERARHDLYQRLEQVLGTHEADTMMELLPPVGWADVATKHDVEHMSMYLSKDIESMANQLRAEFSNQTRQLVLTLVPVIVAVNGMGVALAAILG